MDAIRDFGRPEGEATMRVVEAPDAPIVGLCLTGREGTVPTTEFVDFRAEARRLGLGFEVHAGEMGPPSSIAESLDILEADRIGHGVAAIHDPVLRIGSSATRSCSTSARRRTSAPGCSPSLAAHPVVAFSRAGVNMTISSDDPPFFNATLVDELSHVARLAGLSRADLATLQRRAARAAFADDKARDAMVAHVDAWLAAA